MLGPIDETSIRFRPLTAADYPWLCKWLRQSHIRHWWGPPISLLEVAEKYGPLVRGEEPTSAFLFCYEERPVGYIQTYLVADHPKYAVQVQVEPGTAGVDLFLGEATLLYQGLGTAALRCFLREVVFANTAVTGCVLGPSPENAAAIRAYEKVGFRYWKTANVEGEEHPEYLMLLCRHEFLAKA